MARVSACRDCRSEARYEEILLSALAAPTIQLGVSMPKHEHNAGAVTRQAWAEVAGAY